VIQKLFPLVICLFLFFQNTLGQSSNNRVLSIETTLDSLTKLVPGLNERVDFSINNTELPVFLRAIASEHKINISIAQSLSQIKVSQNFSNASVKNVLLYMCKEFDLKIEYSPRAFFYFLYTRKW